MENREAIEALGDLLDTTQEYPHLDGMTMFGDALTLAISALKKQEADRWRPCSEKPEYDFQNVLVRWRDRRIGCKDYYIFEGYVVRGIWCGLFEDVDISDFEPIEWKPLEPYTEEES